MAARSIFFRLFSVLMNFMPFCLKRKKVNEDSEIQSQGLNYGEIV